MSTKMSYKKQPPEVFCKKDVLKNLANFTEKHLCWSLFLILKRDSNTPIFLWNLRNFKNTYFEEHLRTTASAYIVKQTCCFQLHVCLSMYDLLVDTRCQRVKSGWQERYFLWNIINESNAFRKVFVLPAFTLLVIVQFWLTGALWKRKWRTIR